MGYFVSYGPVPQTGILVRVIAYKQQKPLLADSEKKKKHLLEGYLIAYRLKEGKATAQAGSRRRHWKSQA